MTDTEILDWIEDHDAEFYRSGMVWDNSLHMNWEINGNVFSVNGFNRRDCVEKANDQK